MLTNLLRKAFYRSPSWLKELYGILPYQIKFGKKFYSELELLEEAYRWDKDEQEKFVNKRLIEIVNFAYENIEFYHDLYNKYGIDIKQIQNKTDFESLPVVTKDQLRNSDLETVSHKHSKLNTYMANTGGSSGEPFSFLLPKTQYYRAWAYKVDMWGRAGYKLGDPVLSFRGHKFDNSLYQHQPIYNFYYVDSYKLASSNVDRLIKLINQKEIRFIHGYPSNILKFTKLLEDKSNLDFKGFLFCSEKLDYPKKKYFKDKYSAKLQPSYEQSEMTILASYGKRSEYYYFYPTYGYPELVKSDTNEVIHSNKKKGKLIGTSFDNFIMPLIRYETGDEAIWCDGEEKELNHFKCAESILGRIGEYLDVGENKISVTALIYGQHLPIFEISNQIQLYQSDKTLVLFYVLTQDSYDKKVIQKTKKELIKALDGKLNVRLIQIDEPFKTGSGKSKILLGEKHKTEINKVINNKI